MDFRVNPTSPSLTQAVADIVSNSPTTQTNIVNVYNQNFVINTNTTKTVYGAGADFPNLTAAYAWLSQKIINTTAIVTFQLAAGKYTINSRVLLTHPNGNRIFIQGAPLTANLPTLNILQVTGNTSVQQANDTAFNLNTRLRPCFATELAFTSGGGVDLLGDLGILQDILFTGDQTVTVGADISDGISVNGGSISIRRIATVGFNFIGLRINNNSTAGIYDSFYSFGNGFAGMSIIGGSTISIVSKIGCISNGNLFTASQGTAGMFLAYGSVFFNLPFNPATINPTMFSGNNGSGVQVSSSCAFAGGPNSLTSSFNSVAGIACISSSTVSAVNAVLNNNTLYAVSASSVATVSVNGASTTNNPTVYVASSGAQIDRTGSTDLTYTTRASPALGVTGNNNALII